MSMASIASPGAPGPWAKLVGRCATSSVRGGAGRGGAAAAATDDDDDDNTLRHTPQPWQGNSRTSLVGAPPVNCLLQLVPPAD